MKAPHLIVLSVAFVSLMQLSSCFLKNKEKDEETVCTPQNTAYFPQDAKDRFFFKTGTWWVYQNITTKELDSVWVSNANWSYVSSDNMEDGYIKNKCYETGIVEIYSLRNGEITFLTQRMFSYLGAKPNINPSQEHNTLYESNPNFNYRPIYRFNITGGQYETPNQINAEIVFIDSITINNKQYMDVLYYSYLSNIPPPYEYIKDAYYAKNSGAIKYTRSDDNTQWELIRSHINQ